MKGKYIMYPELTVKNLWYKLSKKIRKQSRGSKFIFRQKKDASQVKSRDTQVDTKVAGSSSSTGMPV
jgi:hypothetical protein